MLARPVSVHVRGKAGVGLVSESLAIFEREKTERGQRKTTRKERKRIG